MRRLQRRGDGATVVEDPLGRGRARGDRRRQRLSPQLLTQSVTQARAQELGEREVAGGVDGWLYARAAQL